MDRHIPFPQADDFEKIITILNISNESLLSDFDSMSSILGGITTRQVSYYLSAAMYLGIITGIGNNKMFTDDGNRLRACNSSLQKAELISIILNDPVFRKIYVYQMMYGEREISDVEELIKEYHPECTEQVCHRRAQTVLSWVKWIIDEIKDR